METDEVSPAVALSEGAGTRIGRYKLLQLIGEGGFGSVFMAEQETPVVRKVALKIIKLGMDTKQVIARFEAERQALAMMDHPNIARVLDAGATDTGRPYFVMELVKGIAITEYCNQRHLNVKERLKLFIPVCKAVQHAHQKGIIHRDLKPSNVMVTLHDGVPVPKVIDFGIAKATNARLTEHTLFTEYRQLIGTPEYTSPEQADISGLDVDTRSDIYSLGVLLYELLTGTTPFESKELRRCAYAEIQRIIREVDPPKPSTRLSTMGAGLQTVAADMATEPRRLSRLMAGELDWIVMKCLEKDRGRRYDTAGGLADDVENYLCGEPVEASPPSAIYRARKFIRKQRVPITIVAVLLVATGVSAWQAQRATKASAVANAQRILAGQQAAVSQAVIDFLNNDVLGQASARNQSGAETSPDRDLKVRDALDRAALKIPNRFRDQPLVEIEIRNTIGQAYQDLGEPDKAREQLHSALDLGKKAGISGPQTLRSLTILGSVELDKWQIDEAKRLLTEARSEQQRILGQHDRLTLRTTYLLGQVCEEYGDDQEAGRFFAEALEGRRSAFGNADRDTLESMFQQARKLADSGDFSRGVALYKEALELQKETLGPQDPDTLNTTASLGLLYADGGQLQEGEGLLRQALDAMRSVLGHEHPTTLSTTADLASVYEKETRWSEAEALVVAAIDAAKKSLGERDPTTLGLSDQLARFYFRGGQNDKGDALSLEVLSKFREIYGDDSPVTRMLFSNLAVRYADRKEYEKAEALFLETLNWERAHLGSTNERTLITLNSLGGMYIDKGDYKKAEATLSEVVDRDRALHGQNHLKSTGVINNLALCYLHEKKYAEAASLLEQVVKIERNTWERYTPMYSLAIAYRDLGRYTEAEQLFKQTIELTRAELGPDDWMTRLANAGLAWLYKKQRRFDVAEPYFRALAEWCVAHPDVRIRADLTLESIVPDLYASGLISARHVRRLFGSAMGRGWR